MFSIEPPAPTVDEGWDLTQMDVTVGVAKFDLYLELDERPSGIIGRFLYSSDLFDPPGIRRMIAHWTNLLAAAVDNPHCPLGRLPLQSQQEAAELLRGVNATGRAYRPTTLPERFAAKTNENPDAVAIECHGRSWSYRELRQRVDQLAAQLQSAGVGRECLVCIVLERGFDMVAGLLAILRAGGAYLPLDPQLPEARFATLLQEARPSVLLTRHALLNRIPRSAAKIVLCESIEAADVTVVESSARPDDLAYLLYTSGSTGRPKAVEISHRSLANLLAAMQDELQLGVGDTWLAVTALSFDIAALELFLPLVTGGTLLLASEEETADPQRLMALLRSCRCTVMQATPATWRALISSGWPGSPELKILCGGEALSHDLAARLLQRSTSVWNLYGPTETTIWSLIHKVRPEDDPVPIGRPLANTRVYVLDADGEPVPPAIAGELFIGGSGLARGYRNDATLTGQKFRTLPALSAERLYQTGDVVRFRTDGLLEFLGRVDNQVKVRGYRIGLEEVEAAIGAHPGIAAAAVRTFRDASGEASLVAFVVPSRAEATLELSGFLEQRLPRYLIPSRCVLVPSLPMTAHGKLDRSRLVMPPQATQTPVTAPRDALEQTLANIWKRLLGVPSVDMHDNFFQLGGHSLMAAMLAAEIRKSTQRELPLASLFLAPTIASQADLLRSDREPAFSHLVSLRKEGRGRPLFIVHAVFGDVLQYVGLAERLQIDRPIYALQARGADARQSPHTTIGEMAAAYIAEIRSLQPAGPYALAGYSFGGLIAYEMACRLRKSGDQVDLLALFETDVYYRNLRLVEYLAYQWNLAGRVVRKLKILPLREWPPYLLSKLAMIWRRLFVRLDDPERVEAAASGLPERVLARKREMYKNCVREFIAYRPRRFAGKVTLFNTAEPPFDLCDPLPLWRRKAECVDVFTIDGTHGTIMEEPNVSGLAAQLSNCLTWADRGAVTQDRLNSGERWNVCTSSTSGA